MAGKWLRFGLAVVVVGTIWLVALPWLAERPKMASRLEWLDREKIDPNAMYYTELEVMKPIFTRLALEERKTSGRLTKANTGATTR